MLSIQGIGATQREIGRLLARSNLDGLNVELLIELNNRLGEASAALWTGDQALATACVSRALRVVEESNDEDARGSGMTGDAHGD